VNELEKVLSSPQMYRLVRFLWEPTPTSPFNPYAGRDDDRTLGAKVVSGVRLGGGLVAGFLVVALALAAVSSLPAGAPAFGHYALLASWSMLALATTVMFKHVKVLLAIARCRTADFLSFLLESRRSSSSSYSASCWTLTRVVGPCGPEPQTSCVSSRRSNQLSYGPIPIGVTSSLQG
jgi:hypothetical protein